LKRIEIVTSHNISIVYAVASVFERFLATLVDTLIVGMYAMVIGSVIHSETILFYVLIAPVFLLYHFLFEVFNDGQSIGKKLLKIKVVSLRGKKPEVSDLFLRWIFRMVDVTFSLGMIGVLFILSTLKSQRIGDIIGHTTVINLKGNQAINLKDIEGISDHDHVVKFPKITQYSDKDMLLVKDVINRLKREPNAINRQIALNLVNKLKDDLGLKQVDMSSIAFLEQVLNDYVILTR
jgi:uncharacterized RDD family membrane protein YckC